jgi:hypothetical protein
MAKANEKKQKTATKVDQAPAPSQPKQPGSGLLVDDTKASVHYSSSVHIQGTAEEIVLDFSRRPRPGRRPNTMVLDIDAKIIMSPWTAKRLAMELVEAIQHYEAMYGQLEVDPRKRAEAQKALIKS